MRSLQECQTEVFLRGEKRIKERRRRRLRALLACIPLTVCALLVCVLVLPAMLPAGTATENAGGTVEGVSESISCSVVKVTVSGQGFSQAYEDLPRVRRICQELYACSLRAPEDGNGDPRENHKENTGSYVADSESVGYTVTLITHEGEVSVYFLREAVLEERRTGMTYPLTREQREALEELLGITQGKDVKP